DNFDGDDWNYTMLPNMGGKNFWTGRLQSYVSDYPRNMAQGGAYNNCTGWGMTMEGIEYNELLYELIADMGWTDPLNGPSVENWMNSYGKARFGDAYDDQFKNLYTALRNTVYSSYIDHQNFGFQGNNKTSGYYENGNINTTTDAFFAGFDNFFSEENVAKLKQTKLDSTLRADIIEFAAFYASAKVPKLCKRINAAINSKKKDEATALIKELERLMLNADFLLTGHPLYDEAKWEDKARKLADGDVTVAKKYVKNARRIVTTWYGAHGTATNSHEPVNDYASRIYAGIMRDYYMPRLRTELTNRLGTTSKNLREVELAFIPNGDNDADAPALSDPRHFFAPDTSETVVPEGLTYQNTSDAQLIDWAKALIDQAREDGVFVVSKDPFAVSNDLENNWYYIHSNNPNKLEFVLTSTGNQTKLTAGMGAQDLTGSNAQMWRFIKTGTDTYRMENRNGQTFSYDGASMKTSIAYVDCDVILEKDEVNNRWSIIPAAKRSAQHNSIHFNNNNQFTLWQNKTNGSFIDASTWTIEATDASAVPEDSEFDRFARRFSGFNTNRHGDASLYGQPGQPLSSEKLAAAIDSVDHRKLALQTYSQYLGTFRKTVNENFNLQGITGNQEAENLFELLLSAFQIDPAVNNVPDVNEALHLALEEAQQTLANVSSKSADELKSAKLKLETAVKTFIANCASFPLTSPAPTADGTFDTTSKVITMKFGNAQFVSLDAMEGGSFKINQASTPGDNNHAYWVVSGNDNVGYTFYNLAKGPGYVLGIMGTEENARAALYKVNHVPQGVVTNFLYATNNNGQHVFYFNANNKRNAWNNRKGWFATWNGDGAFVTDQGSAIICTLIENIDASQVEFEAPSSNEPVLCTSLKEGTYMLKNVSASRDACLFEEADGKLHIKADVSYLSEAPSGYYFTLEADGSYYKVKTAKGQYIPALTQTKAAPGSAHQSSSADAASYKFTYNNGYWTIQLASDESKYLYCFGPSYNDGRLLNAGSNDVNDGGKWEIYRIPSQDLGDENWEDRNWTPSSWIVATSHQNTSNFYEAASLDIPNINVEEEGNVVVTMKYTSGNHRQVLYGAELINEQGEVVKKDYHNGFAGGTHTDNDYTFTEVEPGAYTIRCWSGSRSDNDYIDCSGQMIVSGNATATLNYTKQTWVVDNSLLTDELKTRYTTRVGTNNYKYMDLEDVVSSNGGELEITYTFSSGNNQLDIIGVELIDSEGNLVETEGTYDGHYGSTGNNHVNNKYTIRIPQGAYTIRTWAMYTRNVDSNGTISFNYVADEKPKSDTPVVATMKDLVAGATNANKPRESNSWSSSEEDGKVYLFGSEAYFGAIENEDVAAALKGDKVVTVAAWVYGTASNTLFGYGEQSTGEKFMIVNSGQFRTTTKGRMDFNQNVTALKANEWNLVAFTIPGKQSDSNELFFYSNDNVVSQTGIANKKMNDAAAEKCAIGSGDQDRVRETFQGLMSNFTVIETEEVLSYDSIVALVGEKPTKVKREGNFVEVNSSTGMGLVAGSYRSSWTAIDEPAIRISTNANNIGISNGNLDLRRGSSANPCTYTITAPEGYRITGYSATVVGTTTITPADSAAITVQSSGTPISVTGLNSQTTTFAVSGNNNLNEFRDFIIYFKLDYDVNGDGEVNVTDVDDLVDFINMKKVVPNPDTNNNGEVSIKDITELIKKLLEARATE
ncbi:MAG: alpha-N-acetylglucosaminidase C-terminal domain-containing protein, partial [Bacteroidales bacterium]|nr:alpha-N-acetylglucosaminidase C-terminal domain-containing protein [Candidatus Physcousia equi]